MRVSLDGRRYRGRAIELGDCDVSATSVARAVRRPTAVAATTADADRDRRQAPRRLRVDCPAPGVVHEHVGRIDDTIGIDLRAALADAARTWGETAPQRERIQDVEDRLAALDVPTEETREARRAVASAGADEQRLRESVAELRGRVQTLRDTAPDSQELSQAEAELAETARELSEAETARLAAEQRLARAERAARRARDVRERRLRLRDRAANLRREARATLARRAYPAFVDALAEVPGSGDRPRTQGDVDSDAHVPCEYAGDPAEAALAIARIADVDAPLVLASERFSSAAAAAARLDAPVVSVA